jgi:glycerophosphoryl diester phosphodiesterase
MPRPIVIAHRGASGYLPEHTLEAKAAAHAMGADYIEQDIVASRDGVLLVLHDIYLDAVTDVAQVFPGRSRDDGRFYVIDFDYAEIARLNVHERTAPAHDDAALQQQVFRDRFPVHRGRFRVATLQDELELIAGLNHSTGRAAGIYPEIKDPAWHMDNGIDLTHLVVTALEDFGYLDAPGSEDRPAAYLQCFDASELQRIRSDLNPAIPLVQLVDGEAALSSESLAGIAEYAQGVGPPYATLVERDAQPLRDNGRCRAAQSLGLAVHPYTFRRDQLPPFAADFESLLRFFAKEVGVDGFFTDFPDLAVAVVADLNLN